MHESTGLSKSALVKLIKYDAALHLPLKGYEVNDLDITNSLSWYQGHMKAFNREHGDKLKQYLPLEKVGSDIMAKFNIRSRHGNKWPFIYVDYGTNMLWPYFGKSKDDLINK